MGIKKTLLLSTLFISTSFLWCQATSVWVKPGMDSNDFKHDQEICVHRARPTGANSFDPKSADPILFSDCMDQSGWHLQDEGLATQPALGPIQKIMEGLRQEKERRCKSSEFEPFFSKTACDPRDITSAQMMDKMRITEKEKEVLLKLKGEMQKSQDKATASYREYGGGRGDNIARLLESWRVFSDKNVADLINEKQAWGDYNRYRKDLYAQLNEELQKKQRQRDLLI